MSNCGIPGALPPKTASGKAKAELKDTKTRGNKKCQ